MLKRLIIALGVVLVTTTSFAAQYKDVTHMQTLTVDLSIKDPNVISLKNDRIKQYSAVKGMITASIDQDSGILSLKPTVMHYDKPFSMIVFTEKGYRYTLISNPKNIPAQDIVLNNNEMINIDSSGKVSNNHTMQIVNLVKAMINDGSLDGYRKQAIYQETNDDNTVLISKYIGNRLTGEILLTKNTTEKDRDVKEENYYSQKVLAVSLSKSTIKPNNEIKVYRVVKNG